MTMSAATLLCHARTRRAALSVCLLIAFPFTCPAADLSGCWSGTWESCTTGHRGPLQAEFVRLSECDYEVHFSGRFFKLLPFRYTVVMAASEQDGVVHLSGSKHLGCLFGTFSFSASVTDCEFIAEYSSCKDHGWFTMTRCCP
jgi:hypothetical protein